MGQYILYNDILQRTEPERELYLGIPIEVFEELFEGDKFADILLENHRLKLIISNPKIEEVVKWIT